MTPTMRGDRTSGGVASRRGDSTRKNRRPGRTAMPRSRRKARISWMMPVRWLTKRSRTRWRACRSSCSAVLSPQTSSWGAGPPQRLPPRRGSRSSVPSSRGAHTWPALAVRHDQASRACDKVMRTDAGLHADQARRHIDEPCFNLATRPLLTQHDCTTAIEADDVEGVLADINIPITATALLRLWDIACSSSLAPLARESPKNASPSERR